MNAVLVAAITFACTFAFGWLAMTIRPAFPDVQIRKESQDVVRLGMGLVATMTALLLGLVTAAAKSSFDSQDAAVRSSFYDFLSMDRDLALYGPETKPIRDHIRDAARFRLATAWSRGPLDRNRGAEFQPEAGAEAIQQEILALQPSTEAQRWYKSKALDLTNNVLTTRWRVFAHESDSVPVMFLVVVIAWLTLTFSSFGLLAPRNRLVVLALGVAAISVASSVFLILELDSPFDGLIQISRAPMQYVVDKMGK